MSSKSTFFKKMFPKKIHAFLFLAILCIAVFFRFYKLGDIPGSVNRDEASLGYTAYSLLKTGREEHGVLWPIQIESFGDWKLPGYVYTLIPFIAVFGLEDWVVRLPSALSGIGVSVLGFFLMKILLENSFFLKNEKVNRNTSTSVALISFFFLAIFPWEIHFSHVAYEAHLALFFLLCGIISFLSAEEKHWRYILATFFFGITLFTYHSYQVLSPLIGIGLLLWQKKYFLSKWHTSQSLKKAIIFSGVLCAGFVILLLRSGSETANETKFQGLSIFSPSGYELQQASERKLFDDMNSLEAKLYANKLVEPLFQLQTNILKLVSSEFLFLSGGNNRAHNISGIGNLYPISALFLVIGLLLFYKEKKPWQMFVLFWIVFACVAPLITFESNHTTRFSPGFFPLTLVSAYGFYYFLEETFLNQVFWKKSIFIVVSLWSIFTVVHFLTTYFVLFPKRDIDGWAWHYKKIALYADAVAGEYDRVNMQGESSSPYIFLLYYLKIDPNTLSTDIEYYPPTDEGFRHVKRLGKYYFQTIDWRENASSNEKSLNIVFPREFPNYLRDDTHYKNEFTLSDDYSEYEYEFWSYTP